MKLKKIIHLIDREFIIRDGKFTKYDTNIQSVYLCFPHLLKRKVKKIYSNINEYKIIIVLE